MDVVAGQTYNIEAWYWNTWGGFGNTFFWDYGSGRVVIPNFAFTTGTIPNLTVDTTGLSYSDPSIVNTTGTTVSLGPTVDGGTITMTNSTGQEVINSGAGSVTIKNSQQTKVDNWNNTSQSRNNELYIDQVGGTNNTVNITQSGTKNKIDFKLDGNNNNITNNQTGSNYLNIDVPGWGNNVTVNQTNTVTSNYAETKIQGNGNTVNHTQTGNADHILFNTVTGDINTVNTTQSGSAGHYAETKLTGNYNNVKVDQSGNTSNKASIDVTNAGGPASVDLQQTGGKSFNIIQSCVNPAGCSTVVRQ